MNFSLVTQIDMEAVAKPGRDEARPSHKCANNVPYGNFGRDGLCPIHKRTPPCVDAHRVQRVVCPFNDVERVEAPDGVRAMLGDAVRYPPRAVAGVRAEDADSQDRARRRRDKQLERVRLGEHRRTRHAPVELTSKKRPNMAYKIDVWPLDHPKAFLSVEDETNLVLDRESFLGSGFEKVEENVRVHVRRTDCYGVEGFSFHKTFVISKTEGRQCEVVFTE